MEVVQVVLHLGAVATWRGCARGRRPKPVPSCQVLEVRSDVDHADDVLHRIGTDDRPARRGGRPLEAGAFPVFEGAARLPVEGVELTEYGVVRVFSADDGPYLPHWAHNL